MVVARDHVLRAEIEERYEVDALRVLDEPRVGVGDAVRRRRGRKQRSGDARERRDSKLGHVFERAVRRRSDVYHAAVDVRGGSENENDSVADIVVRARSWDGGACAGPGTTPAAARRIA